MPRIQQISVIDTDPASDAMGVVVRAVGGGIGGGPATIADGADVAEGSKADAAWSGTGDGTVVSILKKIASGGGSAVSIANGADVNAGSTTDAAVTTDINATLSAKIRGLVKIFNDIWDSANHKLKVDTGLSYTGSAAVVTDVKLESATHLEGEVHVDGNSERGTGLMAIRKDTPVALGPVADTYQELISDASGRLYTNGSTITQPVSAASLPLPSGASTLAGQTTGNASLASIDGKLTNPLPVSGTVSVNVGLTDAQLRASAVPISAAALPLPSGAATETGNLAAIKTDVDTLVANQTNGTQLNQLKGVAKGATAAGNITSTNQSADRQALDVQLRTSAGVPIDSFGSASLPSVSSLTIINPAWRQSVVLLNANLSRKEGLIVNKTNAPCYLREAAAASDINYNEILPPRGRYTFDGTMAISAWWNQIPTCGVILATERT